STLFCFCQAYINQFYEQKADPRQRGWKINNLSFVDKIKQMQDFFRLNVTGKVDAETLEVMQQPRCGIPDIGQRADVDTSIKKAFEVWSKVTPLTFVRIHRGRADIMIEFATRVHGRCPRQFDGPLGVLGHAFPPGHYFRGNVHFDEDETWIANLYKFNLFLVAAHEIGHVLGLAHSNDPRALMFPNYKPIDPDDTPLSEDDINAIQAIYGPSQNPSNEPVKPTLPKACDPKLNFDAVTTFRREVVFFKGRHIWRVYPASSEVDMEPISTLSPLLPSGIQAAYENMNDQDYLMKFENVWLSFLLCLSTGNKFWMISRLQMQPGYPQPIDKLGFPTNIEKIDAAVFDKDTRKTYFFVGNQYWRYDDNTQSMDEDYPRNISDDFPEIDEKIDAAFQLNGFFYFFHGSKQREFDPKTK
ncbi:Interstitial collagenase, partial [Ophiophagus hannah]